MTDAAPDRKRAVLIVNPVKADAPRLIAEITRLSTQHDWDEPRVFETSVEDLGDGVAREALAEKPAAVLVAGGDGTVRAVSEAMSESGVPLTIVPSGTGNLLARNLSLPLDDPEAAIATAFADKSEAIDVGFAKMTRPDGTVETRGFVVIGGMGLDAAMIANTSGDLKKRVGWVAYVDGAAKSLVKAKPFALTYRVLGHKTHRANVYSLLIANTGSLPAGLELIPEASVTDGELDIALFQPKSVFGWLLVWRRVAWDNSVLRKYRRTRDNLHLRTKDNSVQYSRGEGIDVAPVEAQPVQLDGDEFGEAIRLEVRVKARSLLVTLV